ncbi:MAG: glycosyltransferase family 4 protein [Thermodesulforhabdaceae bacterium]
MKIAMVSIPYHSTPPKGYGGIERVVYELAEELIRQGHEVVLFGAPGSYCSGETVIVEREKPDSDVPSGITGGRSWLSEEPLYNAMRTYLDRHPVDVIHDWSFENLYVLRHPDRFPFVISSCIPPTPGYRRPNLVAASKAHARLLGNSPKYVHYGLNLASYEPSYEKSEPMVHLAKIAPYKGQHISVSAAFLARKELTLAGNVEHEKYFRFVVKPLISLIPGVKYIGEVQGSQGVLKRAQALVQAPRWFDVLPLVIMEALALGTPVIALDQGGIAEEIDHGLTGFLCKSLGDMVKAMKEISSIDPEACRAAAEKKFSVRIMAEKYLAIYEEVISGKKW